MGEPTLADRVEVLESKVEDLEKLPARLDSLELQILQFGGEVRAEFSALRTQISGVEGGLGGEMRTLEEGLRGEMRTLEERLRGEMGTLQEGLRGEMRELNDQTNTHLRVLHEEVLSRIALLGEGTTRCKRQSR